MLLSWLCLAILILRAPLCTSDGTFGGHPLRFVETTQDFYSSAHCVGETFSSNVWMFRSCQFRNLCFDSETKEFFLIQSPEEQRLQKLLDRRQGNAFTVSTSIKTNSALSLGSLLTEKENSERWKWFPQVRNEIQSNGYYQIEALWVPFHSINPQNSRSVWFNEWIPIYTSLDIFGLFNQTLILTDFANTSNRQVQNSLAAAMGVNAVAAISDMSIQGITNPKSHIVCSKYGVAGIGNLSANTTHDEQPTRRDRNSKTMHKVALPIVIQNFRDFVLENLHLPLNSELALRGKHVVVTNDRILRPPPGINVRSLSATTDWKLQIEMISASSGMVVSCDQASFLAIFLPPGSILIMICDHSEEMDNFNLFARLGYLHTVLLDPAESDKVERLLLHHAESISS